MRPILPIAAVLLMTAGAASIPALTQAAQAQTKHHTWKKTNIDTSAMSASMSAANPTAFQPSTADQQPGAINSTAAPAGTMGGGMSSDANTNAAPTATMVGGMSNDTTAGAQTAPAGQDTAMQPMAGKDDSATTASAKSKKMKHAKHTKAMTDDSSGMSQPTAPATQDQQPGAIDQSGSSNSAQSPAMQGNSATTGTSTSPTANPDDTMTQPDAGKTMATPPATDNSNTPAK